MIALLFAAVLPLADRGESPQVLLLVERDGKLAIERRALEEGRELVLESSATTGILDLVLPVGPGRSASIASLASTSTIRVRAQQGLLHASTEAAGGLSFARPERSLAELARETVYVCVTGAHGRRAAFLVRGDQPVEELADGPFLDLFAGRVPLGERNFAITTDTQAPVEGARWKGEASVRLDGWIFAEAVLPGGKKANFALDLGAGTTLLARSALPQGTPIEPSTIARYQGGTRSDERYTAGGATGSIGGLAGRATLASLCLGSAELRDAEVDVIETLPALGGKPVDGILGLDLLRRAGRIRIDCRAGRLVLGGERLAHADGSARCLELASHLFVPGRAGKLAWHWLVDSGAPRTILDTQALEAAGLALAGEGGSAGGLDGARRALRELAPCSPSVGTREFREARPLASELEVFAPFRTRGLGIGLLGNDLLAELGELEIDLEAGRMSWAAAPRAPAKTEPRR